MTQVPMQTILMMTTFSITFQSKLAFDVSIPPLIMDEGGGEPNSCLPILEAHGSAAWPCVNRQPVIRQLTATEPIVVVYHSYLCRALFQNILNTNHFFPLRVVVTFS